MPTLLLPRPDGFDLDAAASFYRSFVPGSGMAAAAEHDASAPRLTFAFHLDGTYEPVAVSLRQRADAIALECAGTDDGRAVSKQVSRMLGLDQDGEAWRGVGRDDPVVGRLQAQFRGFFTAAKASPYDAATWAVLAPRMSMQTAARLKVAIAKLHGQCVTLAGQVHHVFPAPRVLATLGELAGLPHEKLLRLRAVGRAAMEGRLDADRLRALPEDDALAGLMTIRGVGPWAASHILYRGAAIEDALPVNEPRVLHGAASAYAIATPTPQAFRRMAEAWRPFRMWACVLFARHLAAQGGWRASGLHRERSSAGKALERRVARRTPSTALER